MKKKTSVLIVDNSGKDNQLIQIPTRLLIHWKKYLLVFNILVILMFGIVALMIYQKTSTHYQEKLAQANKIKILIDLKKVKESFKAIDQSIYRINGFLDARGLQQYKLAQSGGAYEDFEITDINEISLYYENKIHKIEKTLNITPLGLPVSGEISSEFGYRQNPFGEYTTEHHFGIDFRGRTGDPVRATAHGKVEFAGVKGGYGNCIIINHGNDLKTLFGHLSRINVRIGQPIKIGDYIGDIGSTGRSSGPHLHYEIIQNNKKVNPKYYLKL